MQAPDPTSFLLISDDRMSVLLERLEPGEDLEALSLRILAEMNRLGLCANPGRDELLATLCRAAAQAAQGEPAQKVKVAEGRLPTPSRDAVLEWTENFFDQGLSTDMHADKIDYRHRQARIGAEEGQCLARLSPPFDGKPGSDVFGNPINVRKPLRIRVKLGPGVRMAEEKGGIQVFTATQAGRVRWAMGTLAVDNLLEVHGDVGLESGDIAHPGAVLVRGDVQAGSRITAAGDIEILGSVEPSDITAGGNLIVRGGLTGAEGRRVRVGGGLIAKFINEVTVEAGGDVVVEAEMLNTVLNARGELRMLYGRVIGGRILARNGIRLLQAGSDGHIPTHLCVARDEALVKAKAEKLALITTLEARSNKIHQTIDPLMARQTRLNAEQREHVTLLMSQVYDLESEVKSAQQEMEEMIDATANLERTRIVIRERTYGETTFQIGNEKMTVVDDIRIPVTAVLRAGQVVLT